MAQQGTGTEFDAGSQSNIPDNRAHVDRVHIKLPPFWRKDPKLWFIQLEAQFDLAGITRDITMFHHVVSAIDTEILQEVTEVITNPPINEKYNTIKNRIIGIFSDSTENKIRKLLSEMDLGDKKPSMLLSEMRRLGGPDVPDKLLQTIWMQRLPVQVQSILATSSDGVDSLASMADKIMQIDQPRTFAITNSNSSNNTSSSNNSSTSTLEELVQKLSLEVAELRTSMHRREPHHTRRPRSRSRSVKRTSKYEECWYHYKFGDKAKKCIPPCKQSTGNGNPRA